MTSPTAKHEAQAKEIIESLTARLRHELMNCDFPTVSSHTDRASMKAIQISVLERLVGEIVGEEGVVIQYNFIDRVSTEFVDRLVRRMKETR